MKHFDRRMKRPDHQSEIEKLDLIEKRVEIQKKRLEIKKEKLSIDQILIEKEKEQLDLTDKEIGMQGKRIENKKAELDLEYLTINRVHESDRLINDKIFSVVMSLMASAIDENRTILGNEPFYIPLIRGQRRELILDKLTELIKKL
jgi:hypothetical protein